MERDLQNLREVEKSLKSDLERGRKERVALEEQMHEARQRAVADQIMVRVREGEVEAMTREAKTLRGVIENMQTNMATVMREND